MERTDSIPPTRNDLGHRNRDRSHRSRPTVDLRSESALRWMAGVLSVLGLLTAGYLSLDSLSGAPATCSIGGCERVLNSTYSDIELGGFDVGIHWFGLLGYLALLATALTGGDGARIAGFGLSTFGFGISIVLFGIQLLAIGSFCPFCLTSGVLMALLFITNAIRMVVYFGSGDKSGNEGKGGVPA